MDDRYLPSMNDLDRLVDHAVEEAGELVTAAMKLRRFGVFNHDPRLPPGARISNLEALRRELEDVRQSATRALAGIQTFQEQMRK